MFWKAKSTINADDEGWQLLCWRWLIDNLGGVEALKAFPSLSPTHADFPKTGKTGHEHVEAVCAQIAAYFQVDPDSFSLVAQEDAIDPMLGPLAYVENAPRDPLGTYSVADNRHLITYAPGAARDLEQLIATLAHEICHPILLSIPTEPPGGAECEEYATDLATVFFGFGTFGGNRSFRFSQFREDAQGTQGWSTKRAGYLSQAEWGFAIAVRCQLSGEDPTSVMQHASAGLAAHIKKNVKYLAKHEKILAPLLDA